MKDKILDLFAFYGVQFYGKEDSPELLLNFARDIIDLYKPVLREMESAQKYCKLQNGRPDCKNCGLEFDKLIELLEK